MFDLLHGGDTMSRQWRVNASVESECSTCLDITVEVFDTDTQETSYLRFPFIPASGKTAEQVMADIESRVIAAQGRLAPTAIAESGDWHDLDA